MKGETITSKFIRMLLAFGIPIIIFASSSRYLSDFGKPELEPIIPVASRGILDMSPQTDITQDITQLEPEAFIQALHLLNQRIEGVNSDIGRTNKRIDDLYTWIVPTLLGGGILSFTIRISIKF